DPLPPSRAVTCCGRIRLASDGTGATPRFEFIDRIGRAIASMAPHDPATIPGEYDSCRLQPASAFLEADFEFIDDAGRVIARMSGWRDRYFSIPHAHYRLHLLPQRAFLSEPWGPRNSGETCRRAHAPSWAYLDDGWQIWKRALAHLVLTT